MGAASILNHAMAQAGSNARPMSTSGSGTNSAGSAAGDSAGISANDFLTLLVTEMQNQDPTSATDPNQYINQLVQVNSLEQLISINQTLTGALGTTASSSGSNGGATQDSAKPSSMLSAPSASPGANIDARNGGTTAHFQAASQGNPFSAVSGNLAVPAESAAADRVAHALGGGTIAAPPVTRSM